MITPRKSGLDYDRVLRWSVAASIAAHGLMLLISPSVIRIGPPPGDTDTPYQQAQPVAAMEMVDLDLPATRAPGAPTVSTPAAQPIMESARSPAPTNTPRVFQPRAGTTEPVASPSDARAGERGGALQPGFRDPRLWIAPREMPEPPPPTREERYLAHLESRINAYNDSMGYAAARAADAKDWTYTDKDGNRWGISPDGIHLGGVTIPRALIPIPSTATAQEAQEAEAEARRLEEIRRQAADYERDRITKERIEATRKRADAQRDTTSGGG